MESSKRAAGSNRKDVMHTTLSQGELLPPSDPKICVPTRSIRLQESIQSWPLPVFNKADQSLESKESM